MFASSGFLNADADPSQSHVDLQIVRGSVEDLSGLGDIFQSATRLFLLTLTSLVHRQVAVERGILSLLGLSSQSHDSCGVSGASSSAPGANIRHVVRLSAHSRGMEGQPSNSPFRWHSECDEQLIRMCDRDTTCTREVGVTILRPSLFMQDMTRRHFAPLICKQDLFYQLGTAPDSGEGDYTDQYKIAMVDARDIAAVAACALSEPVSKHAHNTYILSGPKALLWNDVAVAISAACGRPISAVMLSDKMFYEQFGKSHVYLKQMQSYRAGGGADVDGDIEVVTGRAARGVEEFCRDYAAAWQIQQE